MSRDPGEGGKQTKSKWDYGKIEKKKKAPLWGLFFVFSKPATGRLLS